MHLDEVDERNAIRDERTLEAARRIIERRGLSALTRDAIAEEAGVSPASVSNFGRTRISNGEHDRESYRSRILRALMRQAVRCGDVTMIRVGLVDGCLRAHEIPAHLRNAAGLAL